VSFRPSGSHESPDGLLEGPRARVKIHRNTVFVIERRTTVDAAWSKVLDARDVLAKTGPGGWVDGGNGPLFSSWGGGTSAAYIYLHGLRPALVLTSVNLLVWRPQPSGPGSSWSPTSSTPPCWPAPRSRPSTSSTGQVGIVQLCSPDFEDWHWLGRCLIVVRVSDLAAKLAARSSLAAMQGATTTFLGFEEDQPFRGS
jgi:hypothetical protein